ncbi:hypothetical protein GTN30_01760 [Macrococcoides canis]|uniref:MATE family efflux transporter n=1 Tax=Macrococcoides canis TaxID=1855823 RepID=A0A6G7EUV3_9STAP|nr:MATE family efflux transporter [Macrococcus canis]QHW12310.1 MATE family efflux transporter [Macrococcus canis]QIH77395.1 hypothetical protein GTN30_01760 [Macrococcus canis]
MNNSWNKIIKYSLPFTIIGMVEILIVMIDIMWSKVFINDIQAISAIRIVFSYLLLVEGVNVGFSSALIIYMSQKFHEAQHSKSVIAFNTLFTANIIIGFVMSILGILCMPLLGKIFQVNDETLIYARQYVTPMLIGFVILSSANLLILLPRYFNKLKLIYSGLSIIIISNIVITPLIVILFKVLEYDELSAIAWGTVIANLIMMIYLVYKIIYKNELSVFAAKNNFKVKINYRLIQENRSFIFSQIFNGFTFNFSAFLYLVILSMYPDTAFNVYSMASYIFMIAGIFAQNFSASIIPLVPEYKAKNETSNLKTLIRKMIIVLFVYTGIVSMLIMIIVNIVDLRLFAGLNIHYFKIFMNLYVVPWMLGTISMIFILVNAGSGEAKGSLYLIISNMYIIVILTLIILPRFFEDQIIGVFVSLSFIQVLTFLNSFIFYKTNRWTRNYFL